MAHELHFGAWLRQERRRRSLTREEFATLVGCALGTLAKLESNTRRPSKPMLRRMLAILAIPPAEWPHIEALARGNTLMMVPAVTQSAPLSHVVAAWKPVFPPLPRPLGSIIGRQEDIQAIQALFSSPEVRLVTIVGPPGVGKTTLGLEVAAQLAPAMPDGVLYLALAALSTHEQVVSALAQAYGIKRPDSAAVFAALGEALRDQHVLIVLDNMEHVIDAAPMLGALLQAAPQLRMIVTSRESLRISGEYSYPLNSLQLPTSEVGADLWQVAAMRLFLTRAQAARASFRPTSAQAAQIAAICRLLDGLPLALEIAAAQLRYMPLAQLATRLAAECLRVPSTIRDHSTRQRTLEGAIDWSYHLLAPSLQQVFRQLAVFAESWSSELAAAVLEIADPADLEAALYELADKGLIQVPAEATEATGRWRMLRVLRTYALEHMAAEERAALEERHTAVFWQLVHQANAAFAGPDQQVWMQRLLAELPNIAAVLERCAAHGDYRRLAQMAGALGMFWKMRGMHYEGLGWLDRCIQHQTGIPLTDLAQVYLFRGALAEQVGQDAEARVALRQARTFFEHTGDMAGVATAQNYAAGMAMKAGDYATAQHIWEATLRLWRREGNALKQHIILNNLGFLAIMRGHYAQARAIFARLMPAVREQWSAANVGTVWRNAGIVALACGELAESRALLETALELAEQSGALWRVMVFRHTLGWVDIAQGRVAAAAAAARTILAYGVAQHERNHWGEIVELWAAVLSHHPDCAARSAEALGAAVQLRNQWGQPPAPYEQALLDETTERVRAHLGAARYQECWRHGSDHPTEIVDQLAAAGPELEQLFAAADRAIAMAPRPPRFAEVERTGWEIVSR